MTKIEIKSILGDILFTYEAENATIKDAVERAVKIGASLDGASLNGAFLDGAYLDGASLDGASLDGASLNRASLDGAYLDGASLDGAFLNRASLDGAYLDGASLDGASLDGASLDGASLNRAYLNGAYLNGAFLNGAYLNGAINKETAYLPLFCKWSFSIIGNKIGIGCKTKSIEDWEEFFKSSEEYETKRDTQDFKQIQAVYNACKAYLLTLNQE